MLKGVSMNISCKHRDSIFRVSVFFLILISIIHFRTVTGLASETNNTLNISISNTNYESDKNSLTFSPEKGKDYTFDVTVSNIGDGDSTILVNVFPSTAISNGSAIVYSKVTDKLLNKDFDFSNYVTIQSDYLNEENQIELAPNESKLVHFTVNIPKDTSISGSILGGVNFSQQIDFETNENSVGIETLFERVISVNLELDDDRSLKDLSYEDFSFSANQNGVNLTFNAYNYNAFLGNLNNASYVLTNPSEEVIASGTFSDNVPITAMSIVPLSIPLIDGTELFEGDYNLTIETSRKAITTSFNYTKETLNEFKKDNEDKSSVVIKTNSNTLLIIVISVLSIALVGTIVYIVKSNKKREK